MGLFFYLRFPVRKVTYSKKRFFDIYVTSMLVFPRVTSKSGSRYFLRRIHIQVYDIGYLNYPEVNFGMWKIKQFSEFGKHFFVSYLCKGLPQGCLWFASAINIINPYGWFMTLLYWHDPWLSSYIPIKPRYNQQSYYSYNTHMTSIHPSIHITLQ